ncbi:27568_t:CDS:2, partial [Dentiscutata erythropus]
QRTTTNGRAVFVNHDMRITTWEDPRKTARQHMLNFISKENLRFIPDFSYLSAERILNQKTLKMLQDEYDFCPDCNQANTYEDWWLIDDNWKYKESSSRNSNSLKTGLLVALKRLNDSSQINDKFLNELKYHINAFKMTDILLPLLGITQDPETLEYIIVMNYVYGGSLRNNLHQICRMNWKKRLFILNSIIFGLIGIHRLGIVHKDLHNIRDDEIKQAIIQFRNADKKLQEISDLNIQSTVQHSEAYFSSRIINLTGLNNSIAGYKENEESNNNIICEQVDRSRQI